MPEPMGHILIVEDERKIAEILGDYLRQSGFETTHVENGLDVMPAIKKRLPDLILLDLMLPGMDGLEVCREVRKTSEVPIIMVTAKVEELDRLLGLEMGADDYICKPFSPREVVARVRVVLRRARAGAEPEQQSNSPFVIDDEKQRITVNGHRLDLTPTEFRILKLLVENPGRVYSRNQLLDMCYVQEQQVFDRVIDSHIKNVRKKIAKVFPDRELLHAVYGIGYRYEL